jgi:hypothetical protein
MNTNGLKKFAQKARSLLLEDVSKRFLYWGFDKKGNILHNVEATGGGYLFRGEAHDDTSIPPKWNSLVSAVGRHTVQDIIEEAAYTWFNRLMAIKILEQNGYDQPVLAYAAVDLHEPVILRNAKKGIYPSSNPQEIQALKRRLSTANDDEALAALLISYCRNHQLLNRIFGHLDDYTELLIPGNLMASSGILELINDPDVIPEEDFHEVELIGWLYQFYISDKKDDVFAGFKKKKKARAEDIPAATQIFTPKWIVKYLVENTVGRIWLDLHHDSPIRETMKYLVEPENHTPDDPIIKDVTELKILDPAVGSGHFLVVAFDLLMQMYQEEGYSKRKAVASIIEHNLYGLDICPRAVGLANFAILLKAAQYHAEVLRESYYPQVYAMPEAFDFTRNQVEIFLGSVGTTQVDEVHTTFKTLKQGQNIGSALILNLSDETKANLRNAINQREEVSLDLSGLMTLKRMLPFAQVASILTNHFPAVVANPPYMGNKNMNVDLADYLKAHYPRSKSDLFAVFMEICTARNRKSGLMGMINQQSWMFLSSFEQLRKFSLNNFTINSLLHLGPRLFDELSGEVVQSTAFVQKRSAPENNVGDYYRLIDFKSSESKHEQFKIRSHHYNRIAQSDFSKIPGSPIAYWIGISMQKLLLGKTLHDFGEAREGMTTGNNEKHIRTWWEIDFKSIFFWCPSRDESKRSSLKWYPLNKGGGSRKWYGNQDSVVNWQKDGYVLQTTKHPSGRIWAHNFNLDFIFNELITWSSFGSKKMTTRYFPPGFLFDTSGLSYFPRNKTNFLAILAFTNSNIIPAAADLINPGLSFKPGYFERLPFPEIPEKQHEINQLTTKCIDLAKQDWDEYELSWEFFRLPLISCPPSLSESYKTWRSSVRGICNDMLEAEISINDIFVRYCSLDGEVSSKVAEDEISLNSNPKYRYGRDKKAPELESLLLQDTIREMISFSTGCFMGRYRLDKPGLNIAHPHPSSDELSQYTYNGYTFEMDDDAIIPMMGSESPFSDDIVQRVQQFVLIVWGEVSYTENLNFINEALGEDLEKFLTKKFWDFHKKMYKKRPIYWQFASPNGAFKVLTYMHRMNRFTVQKIRQNYLFKQINYLESEITRLKANEASLNTTESRKLDRFRSNLLECRDYDLLLKDVADRQIEFDLDDGMVENYKLFEGVVSKI